MHYLTVCGARGGRRGVIMLVRLSLEDPPSHDPAGQHRHTANGGMEVRYNTAILWMNQTKPPKLLFWCLGLYLGCLDLSLECLDLYFGCLDLYCECLDLYFRCLDLYSGCPDLPFM